MRGAIGGPPNGSKRYTTSVGMAWVV